MNIKEFLSIIFKFRKAGLFVAFVIFLAYLMNITLFPKTYQTRFVLLVQKKDAYLKKAQEEFPQYHESWIKSQADVIKSGEILKQVINALKSYDQELDLKSLKKSISVEIPNNANVIVVKIKAKSAILAQKIAQLLLEQYLQELHNLEDQGESKVLNLLTAQIAENRLLLNKLQEELVRYQAENGIEALEEQKKAFVKSLNNFNEKYIAVLAELNKVKESLSLLQDGGILSPLHARQNSYLWHLEQKLAEKRNKLSELQQKYTSENPLLERLKSEVKLMEEKIKEIIRTEFLAEKKRLEHEKAILENAINSYSKRLAHIPLQEAHIEKLRSEISLRKELLRQLEKEKEIIRIAWEMQKERLSRQRLIRVIEAPTIPKKPIRPRPLFDLVLACFFSLFGGLGTIFMLGYWDHSLETKEHVEKYLTSKFLGTIFAGSEVKKSNPSIYLPDDYLNIAHHFVNKPSSILITSAHPGEGKSNVSIGIAYALAINFGAEVLLIDADFCSPSLAQYFQIKDKEGLSTLLSSDAQNFELNKIHDLIKDCAEQSLKVLPFGKNDKVSFNLDQIDKILKFLKEKYEFILIDGPSVITSAPTLTLAKCVDEVLLVVRSGITKYEVVRYAESMLRECGAKISGVIINGKQRYIPERIYRWL